MPAPSPFASPHSQMYPALYLYPLNDSFVPKHISLVGNQRVKIGRQTNAKTVPGERNGYFDSKVLSRQHAEIWEEGGKIYIKDVKSSNGTFINGERLSPEGMESDPWDLKSDDIVEFGIDIVGDDNKILHYKVAARVFCIFNEQDLQIALRSEQHQQQQHHQQSLQQQQQQQQHGAPSSLQAGPSSNAMNSSFNFGANPANGPPRRSSSGMQQGINGMGGMGGGMRPPGKSGLTFEHILNRLQGELQKSRETGSELHSLNGTITEVQDTLGGSLPTNLPPYPHTLPPVRPPSEPSAPEPAPPAPAQQPITTAALSELQDQLRDTQTSLSTHVNKIRELEGLLKEQDVIKREVHDLRDLIQLSRHAVPPHDDADETGGVEEEDDDDARSVLTVGPHELEPVAEEDEEQESEREQPSVSREEKVRDVEEEADREDDERRRRNEELGRPRTPEPASMGMYMDEKPAPANNQSVELLDALNSRLSSLSSQFESFLTLTTSLQAQHDVAQSTISTLQAKVTELEGMVKATQESQQTVVSSSVSAAVATALAERDAQAPVASRVDTEAEQEKETLAQMLSEWKKNVEGQWSSVREEWAEERSRLSKAREEWETKVKEVDVGIATLTTLQSKAQSSASSSGSGLRVNGDVHHGLATPPSPRSLSADSRRSSRGPRRKRSGSSRGRTGNRSRSQSPAGTSGTSASSYEDGMTDSTSVTSVSQSGTGDDDPLRATSPDYNNKTRELEDGKHHEADFANELEGETLGSLLQTESFSSVRLLTEGSLCSDSSTSTATDGSRFTVTRLPGDPLDAGDGDSLHIVGDFTTTELERKRAAPIQYIRSHPIPTTAFGVLVIGVAAAVLWKVKE